MRSALLSINAFAADKMVVVERYFVRVELVLQKENVSGSAVCFLPLRHASHKWPGHHHRQ